MGRDYFYIINVNKEKNSLVMQYFCERKIKLTTHKIPKNP